MNNRTVSIIGNVQPYLQMPRTAAVGATAADDYERARNALRFITVGGHDQRVRVACQLKQGLGEAGRQLWDEWRDGRGDDEANAVWKSVKESGKLGIGSLFFEAKANGWRDGGQYRRPSPAEAAERKRLAAARAEKEAAKEASKRAAAEERARQEWAEALPTHLHPYLAAKSIGPHGARIFNDKLLIPIHDIHGAILSLQYIHRDGAKLFLEGGPVKGNFYLLGNPDEVLCIAEGFATGASIREATGHAVAIAFNAGNLLPVAIALRTKYPEIRIVICADDDHQTNGNPGLTKAKEAARFVSGFVAVPTFGRGRA